MALLLAIALAVGAIVHFNQSSPAIPATQPIAIAPTTTSQPATKEAAAPPPPANLFELLRHEHSTIATTQPLGVPVELSDAARFVFDHPILLDEAGHLWITVPDAPATAVVVKAMAKLDGRGEATHLVRETVRLVFWTTSASRAVPNVLIENADGSLAFVTTRSVLPLPAKHAFQFSRALSMSDSIAIPCDDGICLLKLGDTVTEQFHPLLSSTDPLAQPQVIMDRRGLLAWTPATPTHPGSGVARYFEGKWSMLDAKDWPTSVVQLTPFLDGTVQQLRQTDKEKIDIASVLLDTPEVDAKRIEALVDQLGDDSAAVRDKATEELSRIGPGAWPTLKKLSDNQLPEVQQRLEILLAGVKSPAIGSMTPVDGKLSVMARYPRGGILLYTEAGVTIPEPGEEDSNTIAPAWICVQPDHSPELVPELLLEDIQSGPAALLPNPKPESPAKATRLLSINGDWYRTDPIVGPRRFIGNAMIPMLRPSEKKFWVPVGSDRRGRWLFREPGKESPTLLIDPTIQDPTPRLPVWTVHVKAGAVGWTKDGWPAIQRGGTWALHESGWQALDDKKDPLLTEVPPKDAPATQPATTQSATPVATTQPADFGDLLLTDDDGTQYFDGKQSLNVLTHHTAVTRWELPGTALGVDPVTLLKSKDGALFLFNQPGRVLKLAAHPDGHEPFTLEATFTRNIPSGQATRIWLDPAGRICMICDGDLAVLFPAGVIPHEIAVKMTAEELKSNEPE